MEKTNLLASLENKLSKIFSSASPLAQQAIYFCKPIAIIILFRYLILDSIDGKTIPSLNNADILNTILTYAGYVITASFDITLLIITFLYGIFITILVTFIKNNKKYVGLLISFIFLLFCILYLLCDLDITVSNIKNTYIQVYYYFLGTIAISATFLYLSFSPVIKFANLVEAQITQKRNE